MKVAIRNSVFETNSSSEHSISINLGNNYSIIRYVDDCTYDINIESEEIDSFLHTLSSKKLENELLRRKELLSNLTLEDLENEIKRRKNEITN